MKTKYRNGKMLLVKAGAKWITKYFPKLIYMYIHKYSMMWWINVKSFASWVWEIVFYQSSWSLSNGCRTAVRQTRIFGMTKQNSAGQKAYLLSNYYLFLPEITGHFPDKLTFSAGQNENLPVLSDSLAVFAKTGLVKSLFVCWKKDEIKCQNLLFDKKCAIKHVIFYDLIPSINTMYLHL